MSYKYFIFIFIFFCSHSFAVMDMYTFQSLEQRQQFENLTQNFRCLVCQNESLADSNASLAIDLRQQIYTMVQQGKSNQDIQDFLVTRYSEFVLLKPPLEKRTGLLWLAPILLLIIGIIIMARVIAKRIQA